MFAAGVQRLLANVLKSLTATSIMSLVGHRADGRGGRAHYVRGRAPDSGADAMTLGQFMTFTAMLAFMIAPMFQIVGIGTQLTEALAGLERTREVLRERPEDQDPRRTVFAARPSPVRWIFDNVSFAYDAGKTILKDVRFRSEPGTVTALVGPSGSGKSTIIGSDFGLSLPRGRNHPGGRRGFVHRAAGFVSHAVGRGVAGDFSVRWNHSRKRRFCASHCHRAADYGSVPDRSRG